VPPVAVSADEYATPTCPVLPGQFNVRLEDVIVMVHLTVTFTPSASVTWALKLNVPAMLGVPAIAPVEAFSVRPLGREPLEMLNAYGAVPPEAVSADEYATPTWPVAAGQVNDSVDFATLIVQDMVAVVPVESLTVALKVKLPAVVGIPVMAPVEGFSFSPAGSAPLLMLKVYGVSPPVAVSAEEYEMPTWAVPVGQDKVSWAGAIVILQEIVVDLPFESVTVALNE